MPEPYLDVPLWGSEDDDAQQQVVAWIIKLAEECLVMAEQIANSFDKYPEEWKPEMLQDVERLHHELMQLVAELDKSGLLDTPNV